MVIPVWISHMFMMVYLKMKLLVGEDGVLCFQTTLCAFHQSMVDFPGFVCLPKSYWEVLLLIFVCQSLLEA